MNPPVDGCARENCDSVLPSSAIAMPATMIVSGAATPAVRNRKPAPKKKLYAGPMFAMVEADMSTSLSAPRCSRSGASGALVSENGTDPLITPPPVRRPAAVLQWIVRRGAAQGKVLRGGNQYG